MLVASALPACGVPLDADTQLMQRCILPALPEFACDKLLMLVASALPACGVPLDADTQLMQRCILPALPEFA